MAARTFLGVLTGLLRTPLPWIVGTLGVCGLLHSIVFLWWFGIPYYLYLDASDLVGIAIKSIPSILGAGVIVAGLACCMLALLISVTFVAALLPLLRAARGAPAGSVVAAAARQAGQGCAGWAAKAQQIPAWLRQPASGPGTVAGLAVAIAVVAAGMGYYSALRIEVALASRTARPSEAQPAPDPLRQGGASLLAVLAQPFMTGADALYVRPYLQPASLNLRGVGCAVEDLILLGSTASHSFFFAPLEQYPIIIPNDEIEVVVQADRLPDRLRKHGSCEKPAPPGEPEEDPEPQAPAGIEAELGEIRGLLALIATRLEVERHVDLVDLDVPAGLPGECRLGLIEAADFQVRAGLGRGRFRAEPRRRSADRRGA